MKKIISVLILTLILAISCFVACDNDNKSSGTKVVVDPNHSAIVQETSDYFVCDGESDYVLIYPEDCTDVEKKSATLIADYIEESTGVRLFTKDESYIYLNDNPYAKYIFIGNTIEAQNLGESFSQEELTSQGFKIITDEYDNIYLLGGGDFGTLFSAYEFLKYYIDWDCVAVDEINYIKDTTLFFKRLTVKEVPDFEYRVSGDRQTYDSFVTAQLFRLITAYGNGFMAVNGRLYHTCFEFLPVNEYNNPANPSKYHPDWFSGACTNNETAQTTIQLCYTAHGDSEEYAKMLDTCLNVLKKAVRDNPAIDNIQLSMADNQEWCECEACTSYKNKYGTNSAVVINFCNDLHDLLDQWLEQENINRKINLVFFAYHETTEAPVKDNGDGTYSLIDGFKCNDGVSVFYAPVYAEFTKPFKSEDNYSYYITMKKWSVVSKQLFVWFYSTNYNNYLIPYGNFSSLQTNFESAKEVKVNYMFPEGQHYNSTGHPSGFTYLKEYLESQLMWNVNVDVNVLTDNFFEDYFKDAKEPMRKYYEELRTNFDYMYNVAGASCGIFDDVQDSSFWQEGLLRNWLKYIEEAYTAIEPLKKSNGETYDIVKNRIRIESISVRYLYLSLYGDNNSESDVQMMRELKSDLIDLGFSEAGQGSEVQGVWENWDI